MPNIVRFGVSLDEKLLRKFDRLIKEENYPNRSEALRDLIREKIVKKEWIGNKEVAGTISIVYDHHKRDLLNSLADMQHKFHHLVVSTQHIHLDHDNCLEIVVVKGNPREIEKLAYKMRSAKGIKHGALSMATVGKELT